MLSRSGKKSSQDPESYVPIINLTDTKRPTSVISSLKYGLHQSFVDKNKYIKINLVAEFENIANTVDSSVLDTNLENFHHYLRTCTNRFSQYVSNRKDNTWKSLNSLTKNPDIAVLKGDKDSTVLILSKTTYKEKLQEMIDDGIAKGKYERTEDNTIKDLQSFQSFLYRNFKDCKNDNFKYEDVRPTSNQPATLFAMAKTHKFDSFEDITTENIKLRPIVSTCGTFYYQAAKHLAKYLAPLAENNYTIKDTLDFPQRLQNRTLEDDEILVSSLKLNADSNSSISSFTVSHSSRLTISWSVKCFSKFVCL